MVDPDDFVDTNEPEGEKGETTNPQAGKEGVGGLSTKEAEEDYTTAKEQLEGDTKISSSTKKHTVKDTGSTIPQIGSIEDDKNS